MNTLTKNIINDAIELAKENAVSVLKGLKFDDIKSSSRSRNDSCNYTTRR